eukprot:6208811-Pleurochrysis_carterae.AAC.1
MTLTIAAEKITTTVAAWPTTKNNGRNCSQCLRKPWLLRVFSFCQCWYMVTGITRRAPMHIFNTTNHMLLIVCGFVVQSITGPPLGVRSLFSKFALPLHQRSQAHVPFRGCSGPAESSGIHPDKLGPAVSEGQFLRGRMSTQTRRCKGECGCVQFVQVRLCVLSAWLCL